MPISTAPRTIDGEGGDVVGERAERHLREHLERNTLIDAVHRGVVGHGHVRALYRERRINNGARHSFYELENGAYFKDVTLCVTTRYVTRHIL